MLTRFPRLRMLLPLLLIFFATLVVLRCGFYLHFLADKLQQPNDVILKAFFIGVRFDLRIAILALLPVAIISLLPRPFGLRGRIGYRLTMLYAFLAVFGLVTFYISDFAHYSYLDERLNASVLRFAEDGMDSVTMVWQTYPVVWLLSIQIVVTVAAALLVRKFIRRYRQSNIRGSWLRFVVTSAVVMPLLVFGFMGKIGSTVPLRWGDAFFSGNPEVSALGLNPVVFFFDTLNNQTRPYDKEKLRAAYPAVAEYLGVDEPNVEALSFTRHAAGRNVEGRRPNVIFIHLESLGANRSGLYGNPLNATPNLDKAGRAGIFFPNFMVPAVGTARTVFGLVTGVPDVTWGGSTATRNPLIANQYTLVNAFTDYKKLYFIGGSAGWANVKGLLDSSIDDLELWEEGSYDAPNNDVWGISDRDLFLAADKRLDELPPEKPFVAFIQLAGNHRPFTIPDDGSGFEVKDVPQDELNKYGFLAADQYNATRLLDFNLGFFLYELMAQSHYADNTVVVMYGDHNDRSTSTEHMGYSEALYLDKFHVPLVIYGPSSIPEPRVINEAAGLVDVLPTALGVVGLPYENRTLGRDLLTWDKQGKDSYALTFGGDRTNRPQIGLLGESFWLGMFYNGEEPKLHPLKNASLKNEVGASQPEALATYDSMLEGMYQTARYMLHHNLKSAQKKRTYKEDALSDDALTEKE